MSRPAAHAIVVDASVALAWCFSDESSDYADAVLAALDGRTMIVPTLWALDITNALLVGERRKRVTRQDARRFIELLGGVRTVKHSQPWEDTLRHILPLAREHNLSAYDTAYLDLAIRQGAPLATLDASLRKSARAAGATLFEK